MATNRAGRLDVAGTAYEQFNRIKNSTTGDRQNLVERYYEGQLAMLALNRFKWIGLPSTCDARFLEMTLLIQGLAVFYYDDSLSRYMIMKGTPGGRINAFNEPTTFTTYGIGGLPSKTLKAGRSHVTNKKTGEITTVAAECVPIWANYLRQTESTPIILYARRIAEIEQTLEVTLTNLRTPVILGADENTRLSIQNMWRQVRQGDPAIFATPGLIESIKDSVVALDMGAKSQTALDLAVLRTRTWNEAMNSLGINSANQDKRERLVADEVAANDEQVVSIRNAALQCRRECADAINARYDMNVRVEWNTDVDNMGAGPV